MSKVAKAAVGLMIVTILSKIIGFAREQVLSFVYGAGMYTDIYFATMNIPNVIICSNRCGIIYNIYSIILRYKC